MIFGVIFMRYTRLPAVARYDSEEAMLVIALGLLFAMLVIALGLLFAMLVIASHRRGNLV